MTDHEHLDRDPRRQPVYNIIANPNAAEYSKQKIKYLIDQLTAAGCRYFLTEPESPKDTAYYIKRIITKRPTGIIICGGDSTVTIVARNVIRRMIRLGIYPLGRFNNIYRSIYGQPDLKVALAHIMSGREKRIDYGLASGYFFLGSVALGLIPELYELLKEKKTPRLAISWSRLAAQAAASVIIKPLSIKVDSFKFDFSPITLNINLLSHSAGLPLVPVSIMDDGKCEVVFDVGQNKVIMSNYIRQIFKGKYIYSDDVRVFRGEKIAVTPVEGAKLYIDGEITRLHSNELRIETFPQKIRIFYKSER